MWDMADLEWVGAWMPWALVSFIFIGLWTHLPSWLCMLLLWFVLGYLHYKLDHVTLQSVGTLTFTLLICLSLQETHCVVFFFFKRKLWDVSVGSESGKLTGTTWRNRSSACVTARHPTLHKNRSVSVANPRRCCLIRRIHVLKDLHF